jgi:primosomal protein N' (replication factor Y)
MIAKILIATQAQQLDRLFDYEVPESMAPIVKVGARVLVPFQNRLNMGYVWQLVEEPECAHVKTIHELLDETPLINPVQYRLINQLAEYYFCSRVDVIKCCLPPGINFRKKRYYRVQPELLPRLEQQLATLFPVPAVTETLQLLAAGAKANWTAEGWQKKLSHLPKVWDYLLAQHILLPTSELTEPKVAPKKIRLLQLAPGACFEGESAPAKRIQTSLTLHPSGLTRSQLCAAAEVSSSVLDRLCREAKLTACETTQERIPVGLTETAAARQITLTEQQQRALEVILDPGSQRCLLLHGITGSGKTEVYFEAALDRIREGFQVLYLVPEISLTPQTLERAKRCFGKEVALLHSNMSDGERYDQWFKIRNGTARFVLGARSAVFAPFTNLGLIIVDEEHESSYKQEDTPRYHTRWVVEKLAEMTGAKAVFGSATPAVEAFYLAQIGRYGYLHLEQRYNQRHLPEVTMVDMREELRSGNKNILSRLLRESIQKTLDRKEQVILLLNRRGYATFVLCRDCGQALRCPSCDVSLTYHQNERFLRCHYCDYRMAIPETCPHCQSSRIRYFGNGTQKLEEELGLCFPEAGIIRMDVDSTSRKGAHYEIYHKLTDGSVDILLGTQMIAKGFDLPRVTLVGVISADSTLNIPDFRAAERTFQLLTQVAGRAGRGSQPGHVIFQSYNQEHYSLQNARSHNYLGFYEREIACRQELRFPPFAELVKIGFTGLRSETVSAAAAEFYRLLQGQLQQRAPEAAALNAVELLGPAPALIPKIQDNYRWQILVKSAEPSLLEQIVKKAWDDFTGRKSPEVRIYRDRNPYSII